MTERPWLLASADLVVDTAMADAQSAAATVFDMVGGAPFGQNGMATNGDE